MKRLLTCCCAGLCRGAASGRRCCSLTPLISFRRTGQRTSPASLACPALVVCPTSPSPSPSPCPPLQPGQRHAGQRLYRRRRRQLAHAHRRWRGKARQGGAAAPELPHAVCSEGLGMHGQLQVSGRSHNLRKRHAAAADRGALLQFGFGFCSHVTCCVQVFQGKVKSPAPAAAPPASSRFFASDAGGDRPPTPAAAASASSPSPFKTKKFQRGQVLPFSCFSKPQTSYIPIVYASTS